MLFQWRYIIKILDVKKTTGVTSKEPPFEGDDMWYPEPMSFYVNFVLLSTNNYGDAYYYCSSMVDYSIIIAVLVTLSLEKVYVSAITTDVCGYHITDLLRWIGKYWQSLQC